VTFNLKIDKFPLKSKIMPTNIVNLTNFCQDVIEFSDFKLFSLMLDRIIDLALQLQEDLVGLKVSSHQYFRTRFAEILQPGTKLESALIEGVILCTDVFKNCLEERCQSLHLKLAAMQEEFKAKGVEKS
jgi:hypothetical protein